MTITQRNALAAMPKAEAFFHTLDRKNLYPIYYRLQTAKRPDTRARRMQQILDRLLRGERFHRTRQRILLTDCSGTDQKQTLSRITAPLDTGRAASGGVADRVGIAASASAEQHWMGELG